MNIKNEIELSSFYIIFNGSTMNEKPGWYGISHLMEHLVCKSFEHLQDDFQRYGISWNAYTDNTEIVFHMSGLDEWVNKYKYEFLNSILSYEPTEEELENEKKIVLEEYKDSFNEQIYSHWLNLDRKLFNYYGPIGLRTDIENFTLNDCKNFLELTYKKPSKIINVSKYNDFNQPIDLKTPIEYEPFKFVNNEFFYIKNDDDIVPDNKIPLELINDFKSKESIINVSEIITEDFPYIDFTCSMLGDGLNSPLYQEIRENNGLSYYIGCYNKKLNNNSSVINIYTETSPENVEKVQQLIYHVLSNKEKYLTQDRFDIIKDNYIVKIKKNNILVHDRLNKYINPDKWNIENIIYDITLDDVYNIIDKYFNFEKYYKSIYNKEFN